MFGLGQADRVDKMTVTWPSGLVQEFTDVPADSEFILVEGSPQLARPRSTARVRQVAPSSYFQSFQVVAASIRRQEFRLNRLAGTARNRYNRGSALRACYVCGKVRLLRTESGWLAAYFRSLWRRVLAIPRGRPLWHAARIGVARVHWE